MDKKRTDVQDLQQHIGYHFRNHGLLLRALTHSSYVNEHPEEPADNQRLEFLGDAVLGMAVATWVFERFPTFQEGEMTRLRSALVREESLARFALQIEIDQVLRLGRGEDEGGGRLRVATLGDAFEALMGALYLDGGLEPVQRLLGELVPAAAESILSDEADLDAKSRFQEWAQGEKGITPRYRIAAEHGPDHAKMFVAEVLLNDQVVGHGLGHSKQVAERAAAEEALERLVQGEKDT